ncbi:VOC family protein [Thalassotalea euphylliae]|nr:VOC family protein [Thalassotalea euphylliae]
MKYLICILLLFPYLSFSANSQPNSESLKANSKDAQILGLRTSVYMVDDIDKAKHWYAKAFGTAPYFDEPYYVGFNIGGFELGLMPTGEKQKGSNVIAYWGVNNVEVTYQKLLDLGAKQLNPITDVGGGIKLGVVQDPFGNPLGVIYNPMFQLQR